MKNISSLVVVAMVSFLSSFDLYASEFKNWILLYHHYSSGVAIHGAFENLVDAIQNGSDVRVGFGNSNGKPTSFREEGTLIYNVAGSVPEVVLATKTPSIIADGSNNMALVAGRYAYELFSTQGRRVVDTYVISTGAAEGPRVVQERELFWYVSK